MPMSTQWHIWNIVFLKSAPIVSFLHSLCKTRRAPSVILNIPSVLYLVISILLYLQGESCKQILMTGHFCVQLHQQIRDQSTPCFIRLLGITSTIIIILLLSFLFLVSNLSALTVNFGRKKLIYTMMHIARSRNGLRKSIELPIVAPCIVFGIIRSSRYIYYILLLYHYGRIIHFECV